MWIANRMLRGGSHADWSVVELYARVIAIIFLVLYGFGNIIQAIQPSWDDRERIRWFPERGDRGRLLKVIGIELLLILIVGAIGVFRPSLGGRAVIAGIGVWVMYLTATRNPVVWEIKTLRFVDLATLRAWFGDRVAQVIFLGLGLAIIAVAVFARM